MLRKNGQDLLALAAAMAIVVGVTVAEAQLDRLKKFKKEAETSAVTPVPMVEIPAGEFWMGVDGTIGLEDERPRHRVWLDAYQVDRHEVTTRHYAAFLIATGREAPWQWETVNLAEHGDRPVIGVSWQDADAYCRWNGKRLPTEAEWEKAARGIDDRAYPWGNQAPTSDRANFGLGLRFSYGQALTPVGRYEQGQSPYGLYDMAGNVWEWVSDWYEGGYYERSPPRHPQGPETGQLKVLRGGSWSELPKYLLTYGRFKLDPATRNSYVGFRCARSPLPPHTSQSPGEGERNR